MARLPKDKMAMRLKATDEPQPWFSKKKTNGTTTRQRKSDTTVAEVEGVNTEKETQNPGKRSRRRGEPELKGIEQQKRRKRGKAMTASAIDTFFSIADSAVPDVDELRRKREEDAAACGRTVRIVSSPSTQKSGPASVRRDCSQGERKQATGKSLPSRVGPSSSEVDGNPMSTESADKLDGQTIGYMEDIAQGHTCSLSQRPGKEFIHCEPQNEVDPPNKMDRGSRRKPAQLEVRSDIESGGKNRNAVQPVLSKQGRRGSPTAEHCSDHCRGGEVQRRLSPKRRCPSEHTQFGSSISKSTERSGKTLKRVTESRSPRRSILSSPVRRRQSGHRRSENEFKEYYEGSPVSSRHHHEKDYRICTTDSSKETKGSSRSESSSPESGMRCRRSTSAERIGHSRRSFTPTSSNSPSRTSRSAKGAEVMQWTGSATAKDVDLLRTLTPLDRSQRRHRQKSRESERSRRKKDGKKPLYLTLNDEGKPYGLGKPAWIASINKLASGLDPSCTHIRKQTFEAVQTFKDRLNEDFEYSGRLNEDHLRGLMGKAVTKRRAELISLIRRGGEQHKHVDAEVWRRLEKLAFSRQQQEKSEQAQYANACRKSLGQTGSIGENGITENLRILLRRSPDPDEVQEEMQRDKGFGGRKRKVRELLVKEEKNVALVVLSDDNMRSPMHGEPCNQLPSHTVYEDVEEESNGGVREDGLEEVDGGIQGTINAQKRYAMDKTETLSKDEYILKLEAKIKWLEADEANASTSDARMSRPSSQFQL